MVCTHSSLCIVQSNDGTVIKKSHYPESPSDEQWGVLALDVTQAYLNAPATRTVYARLPPEVDPNNQYCARLERTLLWMQGWGIITHVQLYKFAGWEHAMWILAGWPT